jgi:hypothetical protein
MRCAAGKPPTSRKGEPPVLSVLRNALLLSLLAGSHGAARVLGADTNTKEKSKDEDIRDMLLRVCKLLVLTGMR